VADGLLLLQYYPAITPLDMILGMQSEAMWLYVRPGGCVVYLASVSENTCPEDQPSKRPNLVQLSVPFEVLGPLPHVFKLGTEGHVTR
jgi:hypothetical protein